MKIQRHLVVLMQMISQFYKEEKQKGTLYNSLLTDMSLTNIKIAFDRIDDRNDDERDDDD